MNCIHCKGEGIIATDVCNACRGLGYIGTKPVVKKAKRVITKKK